MYLLGRHKEAEESFERLLGLCNDVGLISEEYDPQSKRLVGNFPQAFTHVGLINTAMNLRRRGPPPHRSPHCVRRNPRRAATVRERVISTAP